MVEGPAEKLLESGEEKILYTIRNATPADADAALAVLGDAFADDPLMRFFFHDYAKGIRTGVMDYFAILLRARLALGAPAYVLEHNGAIAGAAMGYATVAPEWPAALTQDLRAFEAAAPNFPARYAAYEHICAAPEPAEPHFYLGVLGVAPSLQGKGAGAALLDAFCTPSHADTASNGVYLDTTNPRSLAFYLKNGFDLVGEGNLEDVHVWCVFKRT